MIRILIPIDNPKVDLLTNSFNSIVTQSYKPEIIYLVKQVNKDFMTLWAEGKDCEIWDWPEGEPWSWEVNRHPWNIEDWEGVMGQYDQLLPGVLELMQPSTSGQIVIYCDEESFFENQSFTTLRTQKGALSSYRLMFNNYLGGLTLYRQGGYEPMDTDNPVHGRLLTLLDQYGKESFLYIPQRLYKRFREYTQHQDNPPYDLNAVKRIWGIYSNVQEGAHNPRVKLGVEYWPSVGLLVKVGPDLEEGMAILRAVAANGYINKQVRVLIEGDLDPYRGICEANLWRYRNIDGNLPRTLNQEKLSIGTEILCVLQGIPLNPDWLHTMVSYANRASVVCGKTISDSKVYMPGTVGWRWEGWDFNSRGRFGILETPHNLMFPSSTCFLTKWYPPQFDEMFPNLWSGNWPDADTIYVPEVVFSVKSITTPDEVELAAFRVQNPAPDPYLQFQHLA